MIDCARAVHKLSMDHAVRDPPREEMLVAVQLQSFQRYRVMTEVESVANIKFQRWEELLASGPSRERERQGNVGVAVQQAKQWRFRSFFGASTSHFLTPPKPLPPQSPFLHATYTVRETVAVTQTCLFNSKHSESRLHPCLPTNPSPDGRVASTLLRPS
jgi:hypothetical protein